jgi:hypothetical protein
MRALVISGGGSKGAFAGGVAQYLIEEKKTNTTCFWVPPQEVCLFRIWLWVRLPKFIGYIPM